MFDPAWDYACYGGGVEQNIVDGLDTTSPGLWNTLYNSTVNPKWMAFRDSELGLVFASTGLNIKKDYAYHLGAKESSDWDRVINYYGFWERAYPLEPYDQPPNCRIYWYGDDSNSYSKIMKMAQIFNNQPLILVGSEQTR